MGIKERREIKQRNKFKKKYKVGLCLSGGGARGFAYAGAFKAFEENGIKFDMVAGTSIGSMFAAMYASNMDYEEIIKKTEFIKRKNFKKSAMGILPSKMDAMEQTIDEIMLLKNAEDLLIPYYAVAVDLKTGREIVFSSGELKKIITASCAIPGVYLPVKYRGMNLIDGGVRNNVPADILLNNGCDYVVTIDCNSTRGGSTTSENIITQFMTSVSIMMVNNSQKGLELSDIVIRPDMKNFSSFNVDNKEEMMIKGYQATMELMPAIKNLFTGKVKKK